MKVQNQLNMHHCWTWWLWKSCMFFLIVSSYSLCFLVIFISIMLSCRQEKDTLVLETSFFYSLTRLIQPNDHDWELIKSSSSVQNRRFSQLGDNRRRNGNHELLLWIALFWRRNHFLNPLLLQRSSNDALKHAKVRGKDAVERKDVPISNSLLLYADRVSPVWISNRILPWKTNHQVR